MALMELTTEIGTLLYTCHLQWCQWWWNSYWRQRLCNQPHPGVSVCLSVCEQDYVKSTRSKPCRIMDYCWGRESVRFGGKVVERQPFQIFYSILNRNCENHTPRAAYWWCHLPNIDENKTYRSSTLPIGSFVVEVERCYSWSVCSLFGGKSPAMYMSLPVWCVSPACGRDYLLCSRK